MLIETSRNNCFTCTVSRLERHYLSTDNDKGIRSRLMAIVILLSQWIAYFVITICIFFPLYEGTDLHQSD